MLFDKKTGTPRQMGDSLIRKDYKGFLSRYRLGEVDPVKGTVMVMKLTPQDTWIHLNMTLKALQLEWKDDLLTGVNKDG